MSVGKLNPQTSTQVTLGQNNKSTEKKETKNSLKELSDSFGKAILNEQKYTLVAQRNDSPEELRKQAAILEARGDTKGAQLLKDLADIKEGLTPKKDPKTGYNIKKLSGGSSAALKGNKPVGYDVPAYGQKFVTNANSVDVKVFKRKGGTGASLDLSEKTGLHKAAYNNSKSAFINNIDKIGGLIKKRAEAAGPLEADIKAEGRANDEIDNVFEALTGRDSEANYVDFTDFLNQLGFIRENLDDNDKGDGIVSQFESKSEIFKAEVVKFLRDPENYKAPQGVNKDGEKVKLFDRASVPEAEEAKPEEKKPESNGEPKFNF